MTIIVTESIPLLREAITLQLESIDLVANVSPAADLDQLPQLLKEKQADLLWLDGIFVEANENEWVKSLLKSHPGLKILIFGQGETALEIKRYFKQGISCYLPKTASAVEIDDALNSLSKGKPFIPESLSPLFSSWITEPKSPGKKKYCSHLTQRENEILQLIVNEHTTQQIALKLFISCCTVETHRQKIIQKLGVKNTAGIVREAIYNQLYIRN